MKYLRQSASIERFSKIPNECQWWNQVLLINIISKYRLLLVVPLGILKTRTAILWTPAASYFHYCVMPRSFLLVTKIFNWYLFWWRHWEMTSEPLFNYISLGLLLSFFRENANYISDWGCMIYTCLLFHRNAVSYLLASNRGSILFFSFFFIFVLFFLFHFGVIVTNKQKATNVFNFTRQLIS